MRTIIQIGANVGNDDFQSICQNLTEKTKIILVEPNKNSISVLRKNYEKIEKIHDVSIFELAITPKENVESVDLYYINLVHENAALSSLVNRNSISFSNKITVPSKTINKLFEELNLVNIDELHIDTEGLDYEILLSLDLSKFNINLITCEMWFVDNDDKNKEYRTGPKLLSEIKEKFNEYTISEVLITGMPSLRFEKVFNR